MAELTSRPSPSLEDLRIAGDFARVDGGGCVRELSAFECCPNLLISTGIEEGGDCICAARALGMSVMSLAGPFVVLEAITQNSQNV